MEDKTIETFGHYYQGHKAVPASGGIRENKRNNAQKDEVLGARAHHGPLIERYCNSAKSAEDKFLGLFTEILWCLRCFNFISRYGKKNDRLMKVKLINRSVTKHGIYPDVIGVKKNVPGKFCRCTTQNLNIIFLDFLFSNYLLIITVRKQTVLYVVIPTHVKCTEIYAWQLRDCNPLLIYLQSRTISQLHVTPWWSIPLLDHW